MPVYLHPCNLIISKKAIAAKYIGGIEQFRKDFDIPASEINQEDEEIFCLGQMNPDQFDIDTLVQNGLAYQQDPEYSDDFTIVYRYSDPSWPVQWLRDNRVFAWHINADSREVENVREVSNMSWDKIQELTAKGNNPLKTIWIEK